jgi:hypothetical protein
MWVGFLKSNDETCSKLETILLDARHTHARHHSEGHAFAPFVNFDSDSVFEASNTQIMCTLKLRHAVLRPLCIPYAKEGIAPVAHPA